ncbi:MAG: NAD(P)/FAD-dependent oxidoreductase [Bilophila sp.]
MDLLVVGAGPAGLAAACAARDCGLDVTLVDEQATPGGQLFRNIESPLAQALLDTKDREQGLRLVERFRASGATYYPGATVWGLEPHRVSITLKGKAEQLTASCVVVASGGMERPVPFPGWTLPGVMGAGGADILLRSGGTLTAKPETPVVLAGNGPLLLLLAGHLLDAGVRIAAWLDTGDWSRRIVSGGLMPAGILDAPYLAKGFRMALRAVKGRIPILRNVKNLCAIGTDHLEKVTYTIKGQQHELEAGVLLRHEGIIPRTHILQSMDAALVWDKVQRCWYPATDENGLTSLDGIYMAGDGAYVHGGDASQLKGTLAGIAVAHRLGVITDSEAVYRSASARRKLRLMRIARGFLRYVFAPNPDIFNVPDATLVCRCECVTAGAIRKAVADGYTNVNEVKRFTRCGMGQCQGRMCGSALAEITAAAQSVSPDVVGTLQIRQPFRPVTLGNYCALNGA